MLSLTGIDWYRFHLHNINLNNSVDPHFLPLSTLLDQQEKKWKKVDRSYVNWSKVETDISSKERERWKLRVISNWNKNEKKNLIVLWVYIHYYVIHIMHCIYHSGFFFNLYSKSKLISVSIHSYSSFVCLSFIFYFNFFFPKQTIGYCFAYYYLWD